MKRGDSGGMSTSRREAVVLNVRKAVEVVDCVEVADGRMVDDSERSGALGNVGAMFEFCCFALVAMRD